MKINFLKLIIIISFVLGAVFGINTLQKPVDSAANNELRINNAKLVNAQLFQSALPNDDEMDIPDTIDDDDDIFDNLAKIIFFSFATLLLFTLFKNLYYQSIALNNQTSSILQRIYSQSYLQTFRI
jgi:hypothetical protein